MSDVDCAMHFARAAFDASAANVEVNHRYITDAATVDATARTSGNARARRARIRIAHHRRRGRPPQNLARAYSTAAGSLLGVFDLGDLVAAVQHLDDRFAAFFDRVGNDRVVHVAVAFVAVRMQRSGEDPPVGERQANGFPDDTV